MMFDLEWLIGQYTVAYNILKTEKNDIRAKE